MRQRKRWVWAAWCAVGFLVVILIGLSVLASGPRSAYGLVRYALPHMHRGALRVGNDAPDVQLTALDGRTTFHLRERVGARPLVLIFGSYT